MGRVIVSRSDLEALVLPTINAFGKLVQISVGIFVVQSSLSASRRILILPLYPYDIVKETMDERVPNLCVSAQRIVAFASLGRHSTLPTYQLSGRQALGFCSQGRLLPRGMAHRHSIERPA
jgi:hypothetical protein